MAKFLLAKKINMTQIFGEDGKVRPATLLSTSPMIVTQIKSNEKDGYFAVQVGFGSRKEKNISKPVRGHLKGLGNFQTLKEFKGEFPELKIGDNIPIDNFKEGDQVTVSAISKGKGFQGVVKRHGFHGGPRSHGQKHSEREAGSIGGGGREGGRVAKGMRMAGRMGGDTVTVRNLTVVEVDPSHNALLVKGAVPGKANSLVKVTIQELASARFKKAK